MPAIADESMQALLRSVMDAEKTAADNVNPPTSGPGAGAPDNESSYTEGSRSAENDAEIKDQLGVAGVEGAPPATAHTGEYGQSFNAATIAPTGQDVVGSSKTPPSVIEPGTSASGLSLGEKTSKWYEQAADLFVDLCVDQKVAQATQPATADAGRKNAEETANTDSDPAQTDNPYLVFANGDEKLAAEAFHAVEGLLVDAHMEGKKLASQTLAYLAEVQAEAKRPQQKVAKASLQRKLSMGMPGEMPPAEGGAPAPDPAMAGGGAMPPGMEGGDPGAAVGGGLEQDPQIIEAALQELANELGVPPEQLVELLMSEGGDMGGGGEMSGGDMGGEMPMDAGAPPAEPAPSEPSASEPSDSGADEKEAVDLATRFKVSAAIANVKKRAVDIISEKVQRGQR